MGLGRSTRTDARGKEAEARTGGGQSPRPPQREKDKNMQNVKAIIDLFGGLPGFRHVRLEAPGFMPLVIEAIGTGPRGLPAVSVAHYWTQNGDLMRDPEMVFEVGPGGDFLPVSYQQDGLPFAAYREAVFQDETGKVMVRPRLAKELASFARQWDRNLKAQGFVDAAREEAQRRATRE